MIRAVLIEKEIKEILLDMEKENQSLLGQIKII